MSEVRYPICNKNLKKTGNDTITQLLLDNLRNEIEVETMSLTPLNNSLNIIPLDEDNYLTKCVSFYIAIKLRKMYGESNIRSVKEYLLINEMNSFLDALNRIILLKDFSYDIKKEDLIFNYVTGLLNLKDGWNDLLYKYHTDLRRVQTVYNE